MRSTNRNAHIRTRTDRNGRVRTETTRRDPHQFDVAITTDTRTNTTRFFVDTTGRDVPYPDLELNGRQLRTLFRALQKHFDATGKTPDGAYFR